MPYNISVSLQIWRWGIAGLVSEERFCFSGGARANARALQVIHPLLESRHEVKTRIVYFPPEQICCLQIHFYLSRASDSVWKFTLAMVKAGLKDSATGIIIIFIYHFLLT